MPKRTGLSMKENLSCMFKGRDKWEYWCDESRYWKEWQGDTANGSLTLGITDTLVLPEEYLT